MSGWKKCILPCVVLAALAGAVLSARWLLQPRPSEIERLFDGTEVVFVETNGLLDAWHNVAETDYWRSRAYEGLCELPPVGRLMDSFAAPGAEWTGRINMDAVMSAVGNESAVGIYAGNGPPRFLLVSRVAPDFLLVDRLLAFAGEDAGIAVTTHRGLRVKEAALGGGRSVRWALDGDLLVCSDDNAVFYGALDRHIDGTAGRIVARGDFRRMKRDRDPSRLISGYAVTKRLIRIPAASGLFPRATRDLSGSIFFWASYADGLLTLGAETKGAIDLFGPCSRGEGTTARSFPDSTGGPDGIDGLLAAARVGRMPAGPEPAGPPDPEAGLAPLLPYLFPDGFSAFIPAGVECTAAPGIIGVGASLPSTEAAIERLCLSGLNKRTVAVGATDLTVLEKDGAVRLAWAVRDGRTVVSDRVELLAGRLPEILETTDNLGYTIGRGEVALALMPRLMYGELDRCDRAFPMPPAGLSTDEQKRLLAAMFAAGRVDAYGSIGAQALRVTIVIHVEDAIP